MRIAALTARLVALGCAGGIAVTGLSGCGSSASASGNDLVSLKQAKQVALDYLHTNPVAEVDQERGALQRIDQATNAFRTPGPAPTPDTHIHDVTVWLAHQSQYPISFVAFDKPLLQGQTSAGQLFRFSKTSASAAWTVTHQDLLLSIASRPAVALDSEGFAQLVPASDYGKLSVSPAAVGKDWAAYLAARNVGDAHEFAPGSYTTGNIESTKKQIDDFAAQHSTLTLTYTASQDPVDAYVLKDGSALVLAGIEVNSRNVANAGSSIKQTEDGKNISGPPAGSYREVDNTTLVLAAFTVPPKGSTVKVSVIGAYYGLVAAKGIPA
jgi:hypothetical protein